MDWQSVGVAAIGAALILDRVFGFLKHRNGGAKVELTLSPSLEHRLRKIEREGHELHTAHLGAGAMRPDGRLRWMNKDEVEQATMETAAEAKKQTELLQQLVDND